MRQAAAFGLLSAIWAGAAWAQSGPVQRSEKPASAAPTLASRAAPDLAAATEPTFDEGTVDRLRAALVAYSALEQSGGWPTLPRNAKLAPDAKGPNVALLRRRLVMTGDLSPEKEKGDVYDKDVAEGVKRFQFRDGLETTGSVGQQTLAALNVPVGKRLRQIKGSLERLRDFDFTFSYRYVAVNIPAASAEAIANAAVERRHVVVVGSVGHQSPTLVAGINQIILNPTWTVPLSITKNEIMAKVRRDPGYLERMHMRVLDGRDRELDPKSVDWSGDRAPNFTIRQDAGTWNALGAVKIDMPNRQAVYMHDTNAKNVFDAKYRFLSHGCVRVSNVRDLAAWLLRDLPGWDRAAIDAGISKGERQQVKLPKKVPVAWIYLTAWGMRDGTVQFRDDVYGLDGDQPQLSAKIAELNDASRSRGSGVQQRTPPPAAAKTAAHLDTR